MTKKCYKCQLVLSLDDFHFSPDRKDRRATACKECAKVAARRHYLLHGKKPKRRYYPDPSQTVAPCSRCRTTQPVSQFSTNSYLVGGFSAECNECKRKKWLAAMEVLRKTNPHFQKNPNPKRRVGQMDRIFLEKIRSDFGTEYHDIYLAAKQDMACPTRGRQVFVAQKFHAKAGRKFTKTEIERIETLNKIFGDRLLAEVGWRCMACGTEGLNPIFFEIDHIIPKHAGGLNCFSNLQCLCPNCHKRKTQGIDGVSKDQRYKVENEGMKRWWNTSSRYNN